MRDNQRNRVYLAEFGAISRNIRQCRIKKADAIIWVDKILVSQWWKDKFPTIDGPKIKVEFRQHIKYPMGGCGRIIIPSRRITKWNILHELAHCSIDDKMVPNHGPDFCDNFLKLMKKWMGRKTHKILKEYFIRNKVDFNEGQK